MNDWRDLQSVKGRIPDLEHGVEKVKAHVDELAYRVWSLAVKEASKQESKELRDLREELEQARTELRQSKLECERLCAELVEERQRVEQAKGQAVAKQALTDEFRVQVAALIRGLLATDLVSRPEELEKILKALDATRHP